MKEYNFPTTATISLEASYMICLGTSVTQVTGDGPIQGLGDQYINTNDAL